MIKLISIDSVIWDANLYPRVQLDWLTSYRYSESLKSGAEFPPIVVGEFEDKYYLIDGWHRINAYKTNKQTAIEADIIKVDSLNDIYIQAIKRNVVHGRTLSQYERAKAIVRLKEMHLDLEQIEKIICIPAQKLELFVSKRMTLETERTKSLVLKGALRHYSGEELNELERQTIEESQIPIQSRNQLQILNEFITMIQNNLFDLSNPKIEKKLKQASNLLSILLTIKV